MDDAPNSPAPEGATKQERVHFLKQVVSFTEGNVRSYDTKAQAPCYLSSRSMIIEEARNDRREPCSCRNLIAAFV